MPARTTLASADLTVAPAISRVDAVRFAVPSGSVLRLRRAHGRHRAGLGSRLQLSGPRYASSPVLEHISESLPSDSIVAGNRFSDKIMLQRNIQIMIRIQLDRIMV